MNRWRQRLGVSVPIVQAQIGSACTPALVAAVSAASARGILAGSWPSPAELTRQSRISPCRLHSGQLAADRAGSRLDAELAAAGLLAMAEGLIGQTLLGRHTPQSARAVLATGLDLVFGAQARGEAD
jgi:hypothetical protein